MSNRAKYFQEKVQAVNVEPYGLYHLRIVSGAERQAYINAVRAVNEKSDELDMYAALLVASIAKEDGEREFTDEEIPEVRKMPAPLIKSLFDVAHALNFPPLTEVKKN